ncbi:hypothetical protein RQP46_006848 [Phenoliferia psychrophenolica]
MSPESASAIPRKGSLASFSSSTSSSPFPTTTTVPTSAAASALTNQQHPPPSFPLTLNSRSAPHTHALALPPSASATNLDSTDSHSIADSHASTTRKRKPSNFFGVLAKKDKDPPPPPPKPSTPTNGNGHPANGRASKGSTGASSLGSSFKGKGRASADETARSSYNLAQPAASLGAASTASPLLVPYPRPPASAPPATMSFDDVDEDDIVVNKPRQGSKQAKMLGMDGGLEGAQGIGENWDGWGTKSTSSAGGVAGPAGGHVEGLAPWKVPEATPGRKASLVPTRLVPSSASPLRSAKQSNGKEGSIKEKKKWGVTSIFRKPSKPTLVDDAAEEKPYGEFTGGTGFEPNSLPLKLQARGDTADPIYQPLGPKSKTVKQKKGAPPTRGATKPTPTQAPLPAEGVTSIDMDFMNMDGIIDTSAAATGLPAGFPESRNASFSGASTNDSPTALTAEHRPSTVAFPSSESSLSASGSGPLPHRLRQGSNPNVAPGFWSGNASPTPLGEPVSPTATPGGRPQFARATSLLSVHTMSGVPPAGVDRRPSIAGLASGVAGSGPGGLPLPIGAWTAPDSWAVKGEGETGAMEHDSSEEEDPDDDDDHHSESIEGMSPATRDVTRFESDADGNPFAHSANGKGTNGRETRSRQGRPGTADGMLRAGGSKNFMIRIFRPDSTFSTLPTPLTATAAELLNTLGRKFQVNAKSGYSLYMREKGLERRMGANEKPVLLQKRRFEQAGYTELDKLEDLGREDNSYLCKLVYKPTYASLSATDDIGESLEFVDLSGKNVETIPIFLYKHAHEIITLNLSKNRPFDLPTDFVQGCTSLRELTLSHMGIKRIPQAVRECVGLTRLDISNNHIVELEHIALDEVGELTSLKCHNNRLWGLPEYFSRFKLLKYLNLSNNRFDSLPPVVCLIPALVELDVSFNTITQVPPEIGKLVNLERLVLLANTINSLPPTLSALVHLKELDCRRNNISDLSAISGVSRLEVLRCEFNQASVLDANWANMRILTASNNSITRFALSGTSSTLTSLNLSHAKLASLAVDMFAHLGSVENLVFDSNQIRVLPDGVGALSNLVTLSIKNNILDELPATIGKLQRLQSLHVSGNNLHDLPPEVWLCSELTVLNASSNLMKDFPDPPISSAPVEQAGVDELLDVRKLSSVSKPTPSSAPRLASPLALSLQKLYLGDNRLGDDVFAPISLMTELRVLNLSFNDIYEIPSSSLFKSQSLEELYLSGNKLTSLPPDDLERLTSLKLLYLNGNKLQTLPSELGKIKNLYALDVGSNVLKYNVTNWPYDWNWNWNLELRYLNFSGNKRLEVKPNNQNDTSSLPRSAKRRNLADFSALTKLHVLGLMDVTLMIPSVPDENEDRRVRTSFSEINDMGYGIADTLGARVDVLSLVDIVIPRFRSKDDEAIFGLFDAVTKTTNANTNTGAKLVKYLQDSFTAVFTLELSRLKSGELTGDALRRAFLGINRDYGNLLLPALESRRKDSDISLTDRGASAVRTGAAGIIVYIRKKRMYIANAGNALAVISNRGGAARLIAKKHEPFDAQEIQRIRTAEGWISHRGYVNDEVDISRSFGFYNVFPAINASPNIEEIDLVDTDEFVIVANHGLWDHMSYQAAVDVARGERNDPMIAAAKLRDMAISYGSSQNVMVMVLAVGDLFKAKKDYRAHRAHQDDEEDFYRQRAQRRGNRDDQVGDRGLSTLEREVPPPTGLLALVFTDIRNSTSLWETIPAGMQMGIRMHNQLFRRQLRAIGGYEVKTEGDAFIVSFPSVTSALLWCLTCQLELLREDWPQEILDTKDGEEIVNSRGEVLYRGLSVRMGIHWGAPVCEADPVTRRMDYFGPMVNRSARISAVAEGGQISASQDVVDILQDVVMEHKPAPSSLDSDSGEEEEEEWLDPSEKQDILALRRLGFGISVLGERRLKGLEMPEMLSLLWPSALKDRIKSETGDKGQTEVHDPSTQVLDHNVIRELGRVCQRLESVAASLAHPPQVDDHPSADTVAHLTLAKRKTLTPAALSFTGLRPDATDEELGIVLEHFIVRVEHALSTLVLLQLGPFAEVLAALGGAMKSDPQYILNALSRFGALIGT